MNRICNISNQLRYGVSSNKSTNLSTKTSHFEQKNTMENINRQKIPQKITFPKQPEYKILSGEYVKLQQLQEQNMSTLYDLSHNTNSDKEIWNYILKGPFDNIMVMSQYYQSVQDKGSLVFCVHNQNTNVPIGIMCLMDIQIAHGSIEFGGIWYAKEFQGTKVNTEAIYLLLKYCIDELGFRRIVWKCDDDNQKSKSAAVRLGFTYEGLFKDYMIIVKNNLTYNRDTAWYRLLAKDWGLIKQNYITWLYAKVDQHQSLTRLNLTSLPRTEHGNTIVSEL